MAGVYMARALSVRLWRVGSRGRTLVLGVGQNPDAENVLALVCHRDV